MVALSSSLSRCVALPPQSGAGMIEFAIATLPVLFLGLGSVELSQWFYTRQAISLALLDAGRAAVTDHNRPARIITAFERALRPLYASGSPTGTTQTMRNALSRRQAAMNDAPWKIEVLSPSASTYIDFSDASLRIDGAATRPAINNSYLAEQDRRHRTKGWDDGRGPASGQTIYEANTAVLRLSWLHQPRLPLLKPLLRAMGNPAGSYRQRALANGYLPMTRQITLLMQSHPVHWPDDSGGKVLYGPENRGSAQACSGWLCNTGRNDSTDNPDLTPIPGLDDSVPAQPGTPAAPPDHGDGSGGTGGDGSGYPDLVLDPNDPACGVTLCCVL